MEFSVKNLESAIAECQIRCLFTSASWALEQLSEPDNEIILGSCTVEHLLATNYFQSKQYKRASQLLSSLQRPLNPYELFLFYYSEFNRCLSMSKSKRRSLLLAIYENFMKNSTNYHQTDAFIQFLMATFQNCLEEYPLAIQNFCSSLDKCPYLFSAWEGLGFALSHCCSFNGLDKVKSLLRANESVSYLLSLYLQGTWKAHLNLQPIDFSSQLVQCKFARLQIALILYNDRQYTKAKYIFEDLIQADPECIEGLDCYSDILFLEGREAELAALVIRYGSEEFAEYPIAWHILGNYHSLRKEFTKAAIYFRKVALTDGRRYSAWILAAQQYLELRCPEATVDCFLRATEANPADFRGWFGLGQVYELLGNIQMALFNYHKASRLEKDCRVLTALADCFLSNEQYEKALDNYQLAMSTADHHEIPSEIYLKIGYVKSKMDDHNGALQQFRIYLDQNPQLIRSSGPIDDPILRSAVLLIAQDDQNAGDYLKASIWFSLLSRSHGQIASK